MDQEQNLEEHQKEVEKDKIWYPRRQHRAIKMIDMIRSRTR